MKIVILHLAKALGFFALSRWLTRRGLRILCYHGIWIGRGHYGNFLYMSPQKFAARIARSDYSVISLQEAVEGLRRGALPAHATVITIDDGWYGSYRYMLPVLETLKLPATVYVTTYFAQKQVPVFDLAVRYMLDSAKVERLDLAALGIPGAATLELGDDATRAAASEAIQAYGRGSLDAAGRHALCRKLGDRLGVSYEEIDERRMLHLMSPEEIRDAAARGHDIQLHTHRHCFPIGDRNAVAREITDNRRVLEALVQKPLTHFCYPSGVYDRTTWPWLDRLGVESATTVEQGFNFSGAPPMALKRLSDGQEMDLLEFEAELCGFIEVTRRLRRPFHRLFSHLTQRQETRATS